MPLLIGILAFALASSSAHAQMNQLIRGSSALLLPARLMAPQRPGHLSEYDELRLRQSERQSRTTQQFMHYSADAVDATEEELIFGFRENQNQKAVRLVVNLARQQATFTSPDTPQRTIRVATGSPKFSTARFIGCYEVKWTNPLHRSREYNGAPMPNATFFIQTAGIATHQGNLAGQSHGCVRMSQEDSKFVMNQVIKYARKVYDPMRGRERTVYDAEFCIISGR
jgi:hypothetical protein